MEIGQYRKEECAALRRIWNRVVTDGVAFPEEEPFDEEQMAAFLEKQSFAATARESGEPVGMYILHPNGEGRRAHVANASYAVDADARGRGIGQALVRHSLQTAKALGFVGLQFNAVVVENLSAIHVYEKIGFRRVGLIEDGFRLKDGRLCDMLIYYYHF